MPTALTATPIVPSTLTPTANPQDGPFVGATPPRQPKFFPGILDLGGVLTASPFTAGLSLTPQFFPGSGEYPGHGTVLIATPQL